MIYFNDVDILLKLTRCGFLALLPDLLGYTPGSDELRFLPSMLGRLKRAHSFGVRPEQIAELHAFCESASAVYQTDDRTRLEQLTLGADMDAGEALLFVEAERVAGVVVTGDKKGLEKYATARLAVPNNRARVVCWEQLLLRVDHVAGYSTLRDGCVAAMEDDTLLKVVFSAGLATPRAKALEAIQAYLQGVREHSGDILFDFETDQ